MGKSLLDDDDGPGEAEPQLKVNQKFAERFEVWHRGGGR
jgi:hypothetical protein